MAESQEVWRKCWRLGLMMPLFIFYFLILSVSAETAYGLNNSNNNIVQASTSDEATKTQPSFLTRLASFFWRSDSGESAEQHVWPEIKFGWRIVVGSILGFCGGAFGSVGGVGGGGIFVPMLRLIIGFDPKSATALSKCMIMGAAVSTVYYNLRQRHPTLDMPIIDYDLALLIQPMLMLGISIGVVFNVVFADWMVTVLLIILFLVTSTTAFLRGVHTWKKETLIKKEAAKKQESNVVSGAEVQIQYRPLPSGPNDANQEEAEVSILENVHWKEFGLLVFVWVAFLALQIAKNHTTNCSAAYWVLNLLQIPVSVGVSGYEAISLYKGRRTIASKRGRRDKFQGCAINVLLLIRRSGWNSRWLARSRGRFYYGSTLLGAGSPSSGVKRYGHLCHDLLVIYVCGGILPS